MPGFRKATSRKYTQEDSTAGKIDKVKQVSVAANFSQHYLRVLRLQAFEDGLTQRVDCKLDTDRLSGVANFVNTAPLSVVYLLHFRQVAR